MKRKRFIKENVDEKELLKFQQEKTTIEDKARETVDPVYADAIRRGIRANKLKEKTLKVEETPKREENPKLPKMRNGAKQMKLTLDESLFQELKESVADTIEDFEKKIGEKEYWRKSNRDPGWYTYNTKSTESEAEIEFDETKNKVVAKVTKYNTKNVDRDKDLSLTIDKEYEKEFTDTDKAVEWVEKKLLENKSVNEAYKEQADESEAEELVLYIRNDNELYDRNIKPTATNLARKLNRGVFDKELAVKAFKYVVDAGVKKYKKEFPVEDGYEQYEFNLATREYAAKELLEDEMELIEDIADNLKKKDNKVEENLSSTMTAEEIAKKHKVPVEEINKQVEKGIKVEKEHTDDEKEAERIALDHLFEIPDYYDRLHKMEKDARVNEEVEDKKVKFDYALIEFIEGGDSTDTPSEARLRKLKEEKRKFTDLDELGDLIFRADEDVKEFGGPGYDKLYVDFYGKADDGTDVKIHIYRADLGDGMKREDHLSNSDVPQIEEYLEKEYNKNK